jgi:hypothetical protein
MDRATWRVRKLACRLRIKSADADGAIPRIAIEQSVVVMTTMPTAASARPPVRAGLADPDGLIVRIQAEYQEMPGLSLTRLQAQRLWHLDETTCRTILSRLVASGFLRLTAKGHYARPQ